MSRRRKAWRFSAGTRPHTFTVYERNAGGPLYARCWDPSMNGGRGGKRRVSLGHRDRQRAKAYALEQAAKLAQGHDDLSAGRITLSQLFAAYLRHRTHRKSPQHQKEDHRRAELFTRILGGWKDPHKVSLGEWHSFTDRRSRGEIDGRGNYVPEGQRQPVRARPVEADLKWLRAVYGWGMTWRTKAGRYLLREDPTRGFPIPTEKNVRRPLASTDRLEALLAVTDDVMTRCRWNGKSAIVRSHLTELLTLVAETGRRISAVCGLQFSDLRLSKGPYGSIRWRADLDKQGKEFETPISPEARAAIDRILRERPAIGGAPLFPSPSDRDKPMSRHYADKLLRRAEKLANLEPQHGSLWHAYRRAWVTMRKQHPLVDVAAAGGWASTKALEMCYLQADTETVLRVVLEAGELRERVL